METKTQKTRKNSSSSAFWRQMPIACDS